MATIRKYYKYSNQPNVDFIGTPTIENGIVGGYSTTSYQRLPAHPLNINSYEILVKVKWTAFNDGRVIGNSITNIKSPQFEGPTDSAGTGAWFGHPNSAFNTWIGVTLSYTFILNTWYYIKLCWTGKVINANISLDGKEWIFCGETVCTNHGWVQPCHFGADVASYIFSGFIDYKECYIKVNNEMYWHGTTIIESTADDYDYYEDYNVYKCYEQPGGYKTIAPITRRYYKEIGNNIVESNVLDYDNSSKAPLYQAISD